jgi:hypothetical protein
MPTLISYEGAFTIVLVKATTTNISNPPRSVIVDDSQGVHRKIIVQRGRVSETKTGFMFLLNLDKKDSEQEEIFSWSNRFIIEVLDKNQKTIWRNPSLR